MATLAAHDERNNKAGYGRRPRRHPSLLAPQIDSLDRTAMTRARRRLRFRSPSRAHRAGPGEPAGQRANAGCRPPRRSDARARARSARLSHTPRRARRQRHRSWPRLGRPGQRRRGLRSGGLIERVDDCRWRALVRPPPEAQSRQKRTSVLWRVSTACLLSALDAEVEDTGVTGSVLRSFEFTGAALDEAIERLARLLRLYCLAARAIAKRPSGLPDHVAANLGRWRNTTAGLHLPRPWSAASRPAIALHQDRACRRRHARAGQGRGYARPQDAFRMGFDPSSRSRSAERGAGSGRAHRLRRRDVRARPRKHCKQGTAASTVLEPDGYFHTGYRFRCIRRAC